LFFLFLAAIHTFIGMTANPLPVVFCLATFSSDAVSS